MANAGLGGAWAMAGGASSPSARQLCAAAGTPLRAQLTPVSDTTQRDSIPATLIGHVVDSVGVGLPGAEITLNKSDRVHAITGDSGEFRIAGLPSGAVVFNVRRIGFESASFTAVLKPGKTQRAKFSTDADGPGAARHGGVGYRDKNALARPLRPSQVDQPRHVHRRAEIERKGARTGTDVVRTVPGVRLVPRRGGIGNQVVMTRGDGPRQCVPRCSCTICRTAARSTTSSPRTSRRWKSTSGRRRCRRSWTRRGRGSAGRSWCGRGIRGNRPNSRDSANGAGWPATLGSNRPFDVSAFRSKSEV